MKRAPDGAPDEEVAAEMSPWLGKVLKNHGGRGIALDTATSVLTTLRDGRRRQLSFGRRFLTAQTNKVLCHRNSDHASGNRWLRYLIGARLALTVLLITAAPVAPALADTVTFNPETCATDPDEMVHIALGREVLRVPMDQLTHIMALSPEREALLPDPPDPSEPEGCPLHPIRGSSFSFVYLLDALRRNKYDPQQPEGTPDLLQLIAARPDFHGNQDSHEEMFQQTCEADGEREELSVGLVACRRPTKSGGKPVPKELWSVLYQAIPDVYGAPFGRPFVVDCLAWPSVRTHQCYVSYKLYRTLNVSYRFRPEKVPIETIIEFDKKLRARIDASHVTNYPWPDQAGQD